MMEAYADESGIHNGSKRCVVAGYVGGRREWQRFVDAWSATPKEFGIAETVGFHAKVFFKTDRFGNRFGPYKAWSTRLMGVNPDGL